jgi:hypothetical protein
MPRKAKTNLLSENATQQLLKEVYSDTFNVKNLSVLAMRNLAKQINYEDKEEVCKLLPMVQKQMDIIQEANITLMDIQNRLVNEQRNSNT